MAARVFALAAVLVALVGAASLQGAVTCEQMKTQADCDATDQDDGPCHWCLSRAVPRSGMVVVVAAEAAAG